MFVSFLHRDLCISEVHQNAYRLLEGGRYNDAKNQLLILLDSYPREILAYLDDDSPLESLYNAGCYYSLLSESFRSDDSARLRSLQVSASLFSYIGADFSMKAIELLEKSVNMLPQGESPQIFLSELGVLRTKAVHPLGIDLLSDLLVAFVAENDLSSRRHRLTQISSLSSASNILMIPEIVSFLGNNMLSAPAELLPRFKSLVVDVHNVSGSEMSSSTENNDRSNTLNTIKGILSDVDFSNPIFLFESHLNIIPRDFPDFIDSSIYSEDVKKLNSLPEFLKSPIFSSAISSRTPNFSKPLGSLHQSSLSSSNSIALLGVFIVSGVILYFIWWYRGNRNSRGSSSGHSSFNDFAADLSLKRNVIVSPGKKSADALRNRRSKLKTKKSLVDLLPFDSAEYHSKELDNSASELRNSAIPGKFRSVLDGGLEKDDSASLCKSPACEVADDVLVLKTPSTEHPSAAVRSAIEIADVIKSPKVDLLELNSSEISSEDISINSKTSVLSDESYVSRSVGLRGASPSVNADENPVFIKVENVNALLSSLVRPSRSVIDSDLPPNVPSSMTLLAPSEVSSSCMTDDTLSSNLPSFNSDRSVKNASPSALVDLSSNPLLALPLKSQTVSLPPTSKNNSDEISKGVSSNHSRFMMINSKSHRSDTPSPPSDSGSDASNPRSIQMRESGVEELNESSSQIVSPSTTVPPQNFSFSSDTVSSKPFVTSPCEPPRSQKSDGEVKSGSRHSKLRVDSSADLTRNSNQDLEIDQPSDGDSTEDDDDFAYDDAGDGSLAHDFVSDFDESISTLGKLSSSHSNSPFTSYSTSSDVVSSTAYSKDSRRSRRSKERKGGSRNSKKGEKRSSNRRMVNWVAVPVHVPVPYSMGVPMPMSMNVPVGVNNMMGVNMPIGLPMNMNVDMTGMGMNNMSVPMNVNMRMPMHGMGLNVPMGLNINVPNGRNGAMSPMSGRYSYSNSPSASNTPLYSPNRLYPQPPLPSSSSKSEKKSSHTSISAEASVPLPVSPDCVTSLECVADKLTQCNRPNIVSVGSQSSLKDPVELTRDSADTVIGSPVVLSAKSSTSSILHLTTNSESAACPSVPSSSASTVLNSPSSLISDTLSCNNSVPNVPSLSSSKVARSSESLKPRILTEMIDAGSSLSSHPSTMSRHSDVFQSNGELSLPIHTNLPSPIHVRVIDTLGVPRDSVSMHSRQESFPLSIPHLGNSPVAPPLPAAPSQKSSLSPASRSDQIFPPLPSLPPRNAPPLPSGLPTPVSPASVDSAFSGARSTEDTVGFSARNRLSAAASLTAPPFVVSQGQPLLPSGSSQVSVPSSPGSNSRSNGAFSTISGAAGSLAGLYGFSSTPSPVGFNHGPASLAHGFVAPRMTQPPLPSSERNKSGDNSSVSASGTTHTTPRAPPLPPTPSASVSHSASHSTVSEVSLPTMNAEVSHALDSSSSSKEKRESAPSSCSSSSSQPTHGVSAPVDSTSSILDDTEFQKHSLQVAKDNDIDTTFYELKDGDLGFGWYLKPEFDSSNICSRSQ